MKFQYRLAKPSDALRLSILFQQVYIQTYGLEGVSHEFANFITHKFSVEKISQNIVSNSSELWVATYKDNLIGVAQINYQQQCPIGKFVAPEVDKLYTLSRFFGNGIGYQLMLHAEKSLIEKGEKEIFLEVWAGNKHAIKFYERQQYECIGDTLFQMEVNTYDNKVMYKKLK